MYVHCSSVIYLCNFDNRQFAVDCDAHTTKQEKYTLDRVVIINVELYIGANLWQTQCVFLYHMDCCLVVVSQETWY